MKIRGKSQISLWTISKKCESIIWKYCWRGFISIVILARAQALFQLGDTEFTREPYAKGEGEEWGGGKNLLSSCVFSLLVSLAFQVKSLLAGYSRTIVSYVLRTYVFVCIMTFTVGKSSKAEDGWPYCWSRANKVIVYDLSLDNVSRCIDYNNCQCEQLWWKYTANTK